MKYQGHSAFDHNARPATGILLVNLGTPDAPTASAVRRYLAEFLSDPRVVEFPRLLWKLVLHLIILRIRPAPVARNYAKIWTEQGSPLLVLSQSIADKLQQQCLATFPGPVHVKLAMRYGNPSIEQVLSELRSLQIERLLVIPMYPQYSGTTTASIFDEVSEVLRRWRWLPDFRMPMQYHDHPQYIRALAQCVRQGIDRHGQPDKLYLSFHGIPQRYHTAGDPYYCQCQKTARLLIEELAMPELNWQLCFQSRFGREPWLSPYLDKTLQADARQGIKNAMVIAPGFSADCLETLEELAMQNAELFREHGGLHYHYLPALNDSAEQIELLQDLVLQQSQGWPEIDSTVTLPDPAQRQHHFLAHTRQN